MSYQAWAVMMGAFWFYFQIAGAASSVPDPLTGRTTGMSNHGDWFFVQPWQKDLFWGALVIGLTVFLTAAALMQHRFGIDALKKVRPLTLGVAITLGIGGWMLAGRLF